MEGGEPPASAWAPAHAGGRVSRETLRISQCVVGGVVGTATTVRSLSPSEDCDSGAPSAISNDAGKMISFVSGGAKMQVPRRGYDASYLPQLRRDAIENAVRGLFTKLIDQLRRSLTS